MPQHELSISSACAPRYQPQHLEDRAAPRRRPSGGNGRAARMGLSRGLEAPARSGRRFASRAMNSSNSSACFATIFGLVAEAHHQRLVAQRQQARRLEADDGDACLRQAAAGVDQCAGARLRLVDHARWRGRCARSSDARAACSARVQRVAGGLQHARSGQGVLAFERAVEGIDEQHGRLAAGGRGRQGLFAAREGLRSRRERQKVSRRHRGSVRLSREAQQPFAEPRRTRQRVAQVQQPRHAARERARSRAAGR